MDKVRRLPTFRVGSLLLFGTARFELTASSTPRKRATRLRHVPSFTKYVWKSIFVKCARRVKGGFRQKCALFSVGLARVLASVQGFEQVAQLYDQMADGVALILRQRGPVR